jgi:hypothetical protein
VKNGTLTLKEVEAVLASDLGSSESRDQGVGFLKQINEHAHAIVVLLADLSGGMIRLGDVCHINVVPMFKNFETFISNLFAYGTGYFDLKDYR